MAKLDFPAFEKHLKGFDFPRLFVDVLGWNNPATGRSWQPGTTKDVSFKSRNVAELGGVMAIQVAASDGWPDEAQRQRVWKELSQSYAENVLIFTDDDTVPTKSQWYWMRRDRHPESGKPRLVPRRHDYFRGQPADLFASKLQAMVVELAELDAAGRLPVIEAARRIKAALDVEKTTKKFYSAYRDQHAALLEHIEGISNERDKRWYASVLLNRLMFVWFLQKKLFLDSGNADYLRTKLSESKRRGKNRFFGEILNALFFEAFAKPATDRSPQAKTLTGEIPYLNGGLFLHHHLELDADHVPRVGTTLKVADAAFEGIFGLFASYTWHLDDTPGGEADEINPDVLGYIFEKYINQKAFGAYYTRPEITGYLAERTIHKLILERVYEPALPELGFPEVAFDTVPDMLARMDARTAYKLVKEVLPTISVLDPAVGSGAFLVAALKVLINVYYAIVGRAELGAGNELQTWLRQIQKEHSSVGYYVKRRIVTDNLYGVDVMEEACEIAKLRLFLAMVSSVRRVEDLEPLPNIDFNILPGNSLVGLTRIEEEEFNNKQNDLFKPRYRDLVAEKNRHMVSYRNAAEIVGRELNLRTLRDSIDAEMRSAADVMNELLRDRFEAAGVKFEQATWDARRSTLGKPLKRKVTRRDIETQHPFHWGYVFDKIVQEKGGFDIILTNPPWEVFKPQAKEFFAEHSEMVSTNKMTIKEFEKEQSRLLKDPEIRAAWLEYESRFPHMNQYFRTAPEYQRQFATVDGRKVGSDLNLYKLFLERCYQLVRSGGHCGIVIPSGVYTDLGAKGLRDLLFERTEIEGLFCFENRKEIFEGVHRSFKFVVLTFQKSAQPRLQVRGERNASAPPADLLAPLAVEAAGGAGTTRFPAAFMRHDVEELARFPDEGGLWLDVDLIKRLAPESHSVMEFKSELDVAIARKLMRFPLLGDQIADSWNLVLHRELHMTDDGPQFGMRPAARALPVVEGKMIHQFDFARTGYRFWMPEDKGRASLLGRTKDVGQPLSYQRYRLAHRSIGRSTDERTMIATIIPPNVFSGHSLNVAFEPVEPEIQLFLAAVMNSFVFDYYLRQQVSANLTIFFINQCPVPRLSGSDKAFSALVSRAAQLVCTTPEFKLLADSLQATRSSAIALDSSTRSRLRAEIDGLVAQLYGLNEGEFAHILKAFPLIAEPTKVAALNAWRDVEKGLLR